MTMRHNHHVDAKSRGQSLVEFALLLPLLFLVIFGAIDFGRMFFIKIALTNAAREGANYLGYHLEEVRVGDFSGAYEAIQAEAESLGVNIDTANEVNIIGACLGSTCFPGDEIGVEISKPFDMILGSLLATLGVVDGPLTLNSTVWMVLQ